MKMSKDAKPYDQHEVENIRLMLEAEAKEGKQLCFEVKVDGNIRIHMTSKVERFDELYNFINENTKSLVIAVSPESNNKKKEWYKFAMDGSQSLNGNDFDQKVNEKMKAFEEKMAAARLEEKLKEAQDDLSQAEQYISILEKQLEDLKVKPNHLGSLDLGKLGTSILTGIAVEHPRVFEKVPVLNGIARVIQEDTKNGQQQLNGSYEGEVSFKQKHALPAKQELTVFQQEILQLGEFIASNFETDQISVLGLVIEALGEDTSKLKIVAKLLNIKLKEESMEEPHEGEEEQETE